MLLDAAIVTDSNESGIHKADPRASTKAIEQIQTQPTQQAWHPLHKAPVADEVRKLAPQIHLHMLLVVGFECPILALMKVDHDGQRFTLTQLPGSLSLSCPARQ